MSGMAVSLHLETAFVGTEAVGTGIFGPILSHYIPHTKWCTLYKDMKVLLHLLASVF